MNVFVLDPHPVTRRAICALIDRTPDLELEGAAGDLAEAVAGLSVNPVALVVIEPLAASGHEEELLASLGRAAPGAKLFVLSARAERGFVERLMKSGASGYVYKGESPGATLQAIHRVLEGERIVLGVFSGHGARGGAQLS